MRTREYTKGIAFSGTTSGTFPPRENGEARSPSQPQKKEERAKKDWAIRRARVVFIDEHEKRSRQ